MDTEQVNQISFFDLLAEVVNVQLKMLPKRMGMGRTKDTIPATDPLFTSDEPIFVIVSSSRMYTCKQNVIIEGKPHCKDSFALPMVLVSLVPLMMSSQIFL
jgi:hypothetical protein